VSTWKPILAALVIFAAGVVTGGLTVKLRRSPIPPPPGPRLSDARPWPAQRWEGQVRDLSTRMEKHLDLTAGQRDRIEVIVGDTQKRMKTILDEVAPRTRDEFRQMRQRIREELNQDQRKKFEELFKERRFEKSQPSAGSAPPDNR
jgi:Spy/CpxP family protein refolding chaperone